MISSFRLPTHSRDAYRTFFDDPSEIEIKILTKRAIYVTLGSKGLVAFMILGAKAGGGVHCSCRSSHHHK